MNNAKAIGSVVAPCAAAAICLFLVGGSSSIGGLMPTDLRCEYYVNPLGVDVPQPRLFWKLASTERGQYQIAYQILVASSPKLLAKDIGDLWDSGKVFSDETTHIKYAGRTLESSQQVFWKVRVWDKNGRVSAWSKPANWTMGLLNETDWKASWIGARTNHETLLLRREFEVRPGVRRAIIHICGLGQYELTLNGRKVGDDFFPPGWTKYDKTCLYDTRDLTPALRRGKNAIGILLGNGMYHVEGAPGRFKKFRGSFGPLKAIAQLRLEYNDGTVETICTDTNWRVYPGPITFGCVFGGEDFDARLVQRGWDKPGFDDSGWEHAVELDGPGGELRGLSCAAPPIRAFEVFKPISVSSPTNGVTVYDLGQNASIMLRLKVRGPAGSVVRVIPAELVDTNGFVDRGSCGGRRGLAYWQYTLAGRGTEKYAAKFYYHGARFLQVERYPAPGQETLPVVESIEGVVVHSASEPAGEFECSNGLFNRIRKLVRWAQRSNMMSVLTDCPHRERLGWLEQYHLNGPAIRYEFDLNALYTKGMNDIADSQLESGLVPTTAPEYTAFRDPNDTTRPRNNFGDSPEWSSAAVIVPWQQYQFAGDIELLRKHYEMMKRYLAYLGSRATNLIVNYGLGDWYDIGPNPPGVSQLTPVALPATAFYYYDTWIMAQVAALLGRPDDAAEFSARAEAIRAAFNRAFFDTNKLCYATCSQTANAIPLVMNLVEPQMRAAVLDALVRDVRAHTNSVTAGDVGHRYLIRALADAGRSDVLYQMHNQSERPGYGYQLKIGATSLTEAWDARRRSSQNHFMLGHIIEWFYHDIAGIRPDPAGPGFKKIIIAPQPVGDLTWARASYNSIHGKISAHWRRSGNKLSLDVYIPANTTAMVVVPARSVQAVRVNGRPVDRCREVQFVRQENNCAVFAIGSGKYTFEATTGN